MFIFHAEYLSTDSSVPGITRKFKMGFDSDFTI